MADCSYDTKDLHEIIHFLISNCPQIKEIYLFGSRAYRTGSFRSDIDLIACLSEGIPDRPLRDDLHQEFPSVDLFLSTSDQCARSITNGSVINKRSNYDTVFEQVDAIRLWDNKNGFNEDFKYWSQTIAKGINFCMSVIPSYPMESPEETVEKLLANLSAAKIHTYFAGTNIPQIANSIVSLITTAFMKPSKFSEKAKSFSFDTITLKNEYDFQNLIHFVLRPIFQTIEPEPFEIVIDGNKKFADFAILDNQIVIEAKYIDSTSKKAEVCKTLDGLASFYSMNPNIRYLIFLILYEDKVDIDGVKLEQLYSNQYKPVSIITKFIANTYHE